MRLSSLTSEFAGDLGQDLRYAVRGLRNAPIFTGVTTLSLTLAIGVNVFGLGVLNAVVLRPLDVADPGSLYQMRTGPRTSGALLTTSYPAFEDFRERNATLSAMAGFYAYSEAALSFGNGVRKARGYEVTGNYFDFLGAQPEVGQFFHEADERGRSSAPYVVLSNALWRSAFDGDRGVVGTTVRLNQHPYTVIGVASARFHGTERFEWPDYWIPMVNQAGEVGWDYLHDRARNALTLICRLKPEVTPQRAAEDLNAIAAQLAKEYPKTDKGMAVRLIRPGLYGDDGDVVRGFLYCVSALTLLLLAAVCANLASLFAARGMDRSRELALRMALGSSRLRLMRQPLAEALVIALIGGAAGLVSGHLLLGALNRWQPSFVVSGQRLAASIDGEGRVYLAGLALTLISALLFGLLPARQAWQGSPLQVMKGEPADSARRRRVALRDLLLGAQIAICALLVVASLVAVRGLVRALGVPLGFEPQGVMLAEMDLSQVGQEGQLALDKEKSMIEAVRTIPGVTAVGAVRNTPMGGGKRATPVYRPETTEFLADNYALATRVYPMSPGYLRTAGTRLLDGRDVSWQDTEKTPFVAIVNGTFARKMWGDAPPIGQRFVLSARLMEVVGVVEDGKYHSLMESPQAAVFLPLSQSEGSGVVLVVRSDRAPKEIALALQRTLSSLEPYAPLTIGSWPDALLSQEVPARASAVTLGLMGLLAAMLAVTGIFGMAAHGVSRRMKELGIRMALGARARQVVAAAVGRPAILLGLGSAAGLLAGILASRLLGRIVYQADPGHPLVLAGAVLAMTLIGMAGSAIPAARALAVDPSRLMRDE